MNPIVSNTLFHFTGIDHERGIFKPDEEAFNTLKSIIESKQFQLAPNPRNWSIFDTDEPHRHMNFEIPMVCFTETPIEYIGMHMMVFGHFGLGMKIEWAIRNRAQNVIYCDKKEPNFYGRTLAGVLDFIHHNLAVDPNTQAKWYWFRSLVGVTEDIIYRNEREWRVIGRSENKPGGGTYFTPKSAEFTVDDIDVVVCPSSLVDDLNIFLNKLPGFAICNFKIISAESLLKVIDGKKG